MADANYSYPAYPFPGPGPGPGPVGVPGGTDRSYSVDIMVCAIITAVISFVFVGLRFYTRFFIVHILHLEDWMILAAQACSTVMCIGFVIEAMYGHGTHAWLVPKENVPPMVKAAWFAILFYQLSLWCSQVSIVLLYIRIWTFPWVRRATKTLLVFVMIYKALIIVVVATACVPLHAFWDMELQKDAYCHTKAIWWATTYLHIITDFTTYLLPMPIILQVKFPKRQKILLFILFAFGFFVCLISIIRLYLLKITADTQDVTYDNVSVAFWTCVETNGTITVACFMTMKPLLSRWFPGLVEEQPNRDIVWSHLGRNPTIGSRPMRFHPARLPQSLTASLRGYEVLSTDERAKRA